MSKIKAYSTKMYPLIFSGEFEVIKKLNIELLQAVKEFNLLFHEVSQSGNASELIWGDKKTF